MSGKLFKISLISLFLLAACFAANGEVQQDITYCTIDGTQVKMDIYLPDDAGSKPIPAVMYVHGGGWVKGDKRSGAGMPMAKALAAGGYVVAAIDYRLAPQFKFPAQIEDVKCAIRYLRANAKTYNIDPKRIGVIGGSAGGHLVALLGLTTPKDGFEGKGGYEKESSSVQAVVDIFGPTDLPAMGIGTETLQLGKAVFGATSPDDPILKKASPLTYVSKNAPPFLILHGDKDKTVPLKQSQVLYDKLKAAGTDATLVVVKNGAHGFKQEGAISPTHVEMVKMVVEFFDRKLKYQ